MTDSSRTAGELFIVDNSDDAWKGIRYLQDWTEIASAFDIATGYFEIGALLALEGKWQKLEKIRILMGDEVSARTKQALLEGLKKKVAEVLDASAEETKESNDFLTGAAAVVDALQRKQIECKVYAKRKFHAKAYITHPRVAVIGSVALVGSSNFTLPGLTQNIELNIQVRAPGDVRQLQEWFELHWNEGEDISADVIRVIERQIAKYTPFQVYAKALQELFKSHELPPAAWEQTQSKMYPQLDLYQKEAYQSLLKISRQNRGALLCDGVGLGKTFVGLLLIERLIMLERKRVVLLVPKSGRIAVWERNIRKFLPHLFKGFSNLRIFNHTDLMRSGDFPEEIERMKEQADVVIIDEAHHFRNRGLANLEGEIRSRYWQLYDLTKEKTVFLLTATPVNNHLRDFQHLVELFSRVENPGAFASTLGIHALPAYFNKLEKQLLQIVSNKGMGELFDQNQVEMEPLLFEDKLFRELVVQRSRAYVRASQEQNGGKDVIFPDKAPPQVVPYSVKKTYGHLLGKMEKAFARVKPLFALALYYPLGYWKGDPTQLDSFDVNRQKQVVRLIRILFLKRFESSIVAFESSCQTLLLKLLAFLRVNIDKTNPTEVRRLEKWEAQNEDLLNHIKARRGELHDEETAEENELGDEFIEDFAPLPRADYKIDEIFDETYSDLETVVDFLEEIQRFDPSHDDKLAALVNLLTKKDPVLKKNKVIIFTEFMTTARYLKMQLVARGIKGVDEIDSDSKRDRAVVIQEFAPYYNESSSPALAAEGRKEIRVLISTDVLSEGLNLQDATRLINYDLHWNPVRLMQRIGRVDRRMNPAVEKQLIADHPDQAPLRGKVAYWNFLPPDELDDLLRLYSRVAYKTLRISKVFGIEGKKLLTPQDDFDALRDFTHAYEGEATPTEKLHLEYQQMLRENPALEPFLNFVPLRLFSGRENLKPGARAVFLCYRLPAEDKTLPPAEAWHGEAGRTGWYLYDLTNEQVLEEPTRIAEIVRSTPETPRRLEIEQPSLREIRLKIEKHIKNTYLKQIQAPVGVKPVLKCWMELN